MAACVHMMKSLTTLPLDQKCSNEKYNTIQYIAKQNNPETLEKIYRNIKPKENSN